MAIKNILSKYDYKTLNKEHCDKIRATQCELSKSDKDYLQKYIRNHNSYSKEEVIKCIVFYCIWEPDSAIKFAREKGVLRYRSFGGMKNNAIIILLNYCRK